MRTTTLVILVTIFISAWLLPSCAATGPTPTATVAEPARIAVEEARHPKARWPESRSFWKGLLLAVTMTGDSRRRPNKNSLRIADRVCGRGHLYPQSVPG
jgi:hypothetical protein